MIIEIDTSLADKLGDITINQLVFLTLALNENQANHQDVHSLLSRVDEQEIQELIDKDLVSKVVNDTNIIIIPTEKLISLTKNEKDYFDEFYEKYPVYVHRPDGTKGFLRANVNKCRIQYNKIVGKSKATHNHIMNCLIFELAEKYRTDKIAYMKTMWKWITNHEWESYEEQLLVKSNNSSVKPQKIKLDEFA